MLQKQEAYMVMLNLKLTGLDKKWTDTMVGPRTCIIHSTVSEVYLLKIGAAICNPL